MNVLTLLTYLFCLSQLAPRPGAIVLTEQLTSTGWRVTLEPQKEAKENSNVFVAFILLLQMFSPPSMKIDDQLIMAVQLATEFHTQKLLVH